MYENLLEEINKRIALMESVKVTVENMPNLRSLGPSGFTVFTDGSLGVSAPHDPAVWNEHQLVLESAGWSMMKENRWTEDGTLARFYRNGATNMVIYYRPHMAGSTCKLNLLGYETERKPIYEVTCLEA